MEILAVHLNIDLAEYQLAGVSTLSALAENPSMKQATSTSHLQRGMHGQLLR